MSSLQKQFSKTGLQEWKTSLHSWTWSIWPPENNEKKNEKKPTLSSLNDLDKKQVIKTKISTNLAKIVPWVPAMKMNYVAYDKIN